MRVLALLEIDNNAANGLDYHQNAHLLDGVTVERKPLAKALAQWRVKKLRDEMFPLPLLNPTVEEERNLVPPNKFAELKLALEK